MDLQHEETQLILALGGLHYYPDTKNVCFGLLKKDGSISPDFRITAPSDPCKYEHQRGPYMLHN